MSDSISASRRAKVDEARQAWIRRLVDTSRRNNLLYFRDLRVGTLDFAEAKAGAVEELLMGAKVPLAHLMPGDESAPIRLREIVRKALSNREERGLETLYLAYGMATWPVDDGGRPPEAAAVLVPIAVEGRNAPLLVRSGPPRPNLALTYALAEMGFAADVDEESEDADMMLGRLQASVALEGFRVRSRAVLGNFSFQKLSMVRDLQEHADALAAHDVVASLASDPEARRVVTERRIAVDPRELDAIPPDAEFMPLDADSSQQAVIHAVSRGSDGVIQGPPGCGKSQTIANLVATLVAEGKRVLFVAEKRAALEAVHKRLQSKGLGHLALDLHGATVSQKAVVARIGETLASIRSAADPNDDALNARFEDRRQRLATHRRLMHLPTEPSGMTPYALQAALFERGPETKTRWRDGDLARLTPDVATRIEDRLDEAEGHADLFLRRGPSPWREAALSDGRTVQTALDAALRLRDELPEALRLVAQVAESLGAEPPTTLDRSRALLDLAERTNDLLAGYDPAIMEEAPTLARGLRPGEESGFSGLWTRLFDGDFRRARRRLRSLAADGKGSLSHVEEAARLAEAWRSWKVPGRRVEIPASLGPKWKGLDESLTSLRPTLPRVDVEHTPDPHALFVALVRDEVAARAVPQVRTLEGELDRLGASKLIEELRADAEREPDGESPFGSFSWRDRFCEAWMRSCLDAARASHPELAGFSGAAHDKVAAEFRRLDGERTDLAAARVQRAHAEAAVATMNAHPAQTDVVRAETQKRSRHKPLRRLLTEAPDVLPAVCPCWMASPLNVSELLPAGRTLFDVVVFDEASQVLPEDAISAILRGDRLIVAGDRHQLPPTQFFADGGEEPEDDSDVAGFQSLLDQMGAFVEPWPLLWHYRSRDERLIAFSNRFVYDDRLVTFPGVGGEPCVSHVRVDALGADEESSSAEVGKAVELILDHAANRPEVSLGVITMGLKHARRIETALDRALEGRPELEPFFDPKRSERFFIKNLEQVQGDERDAILISIGYGKNADGKLPYRFGPLLFEGGERRLNVAVTRARSHMTVVSSFSHLDMDPERSKARGVVLLREFLRFAAVGGDALSDPRNAVAGLDPLQRDIASSLSERGLPIRTQYGVSPLRIEAAVGHPNQTGRFVLAVETDGESYAAQPTVRDRDRLRQRQLESLDWRFHRVWSTEWANHREREIERIVAAWQATSKDLPDIPVIELSERPSAPPILPSRSAPPPVTRKSDIEDVAEDELDGLVRWVREGGVKTDDEIVDEVAEFLGYARVGAKIDRTVRASIARTRDSDAPDPD